MSNLIKILAFLLFLSACKSTNSEVKYSEIPSDRSNAKAKPGAGWDLDKEQLIGNCVVGNVEDVGSQSSSVRFTSSMSTEELHSQLGFSMSAKAKSALYSGSAAANFSSENSEDKFSSVTVYSARYEFKNVYLTPTGLSPIAQSVYDRDVAMNYSDFEKACGHEFIQQIVVGASLLMAARIDFISEEAKSAFNGKFKIKGSAFSAKSELMKASEEFKEQASVTITLFQKGGDVSQVSTAFNGMDSKNGYAIIRCSMANIEPCIQVLESIIGYATSREPGNFPHQIKDNGANGGAADLMYIAYPYITAGVFPGDSLLRELLYEQRRKIEEKLNRNIFLRNRRNTFSKISIDGAQEMFNKLDRAERHNQALITDAIRACFDAIKKEDCELKTNALFAQEEDGGFIDFSDSELEIKLADLADCEKGYVREGVGCKRVTCPSGKRFEDKWTASIAGGTGDYICDENASDTLLKVSCDEDHEENGLSCVARSCGVQPHNTTYTAAISNGIGNFKCEYGSDLLLSVASCNIGYEKRALSCQKIAVEVPLTKKTCRDSKGKTLKHDERSTVKLCAGTKYEQRMYTCNDGKLKLGATVVLGKCGDGRSGGALVY